MTRDDWDKFIEERYSELIAAAVRTVGFQAAEDAVQGAILRSITSENYLKCETNPFTWLMQAVKSVASNRRRTESRRAAMHRDAKALLRDRPPRGHRTARKPGADAVYGGGE